MNLFSNFPIKQQSDNERVVRVVHRHWFNILQQFLIVFVILVVLLGAFFFAPFFFPQLMTPELYSLFLFIEDFFMLIAWTYAFLIWIDYYFDVWIITNERIINIEQRGLFVRHVSELNLGKIQDVTTEVEGFIPTVLNYGEVFIQTAGEQERFVFRQVPDPYHIKTEIMSLHKELGGQKL